MKRKRSVSPDPEELGGGCDDCGPSESSEFYIRPAKRITMCYNTPKQQKDEKKRLMKMCKKKLRRMDDEANLRRSVLINNTFRRLKTELGLDQKGRYYGYGVNPRSPLGTRSRFSIRRSHREEVLRQKYLLDKPLSAARCDLMDGIAASTDDARNVDSDTNSLDPVTAPSPAPDTDGCIGASPHAQADDICDVEMRDESTSAGFPSTHFGGFCSPSEEQSSTRQTECESLAHRGEIAAPACSCENSEETLVNSASSEGCGIRQEEAGLDPLGGSHFTLDKRTIICADKQSQHEDEHAELSADYSIAPAAETDDGRDASRVQHVTYQADHVTGDDTDSEEIDVVTVSVSHESEATRIQASSHLTAAPCYTDRPQPSHSPLQNGKSISNLELSSFSGGLGSVAAAEPLDLWSKAPFKSQPSSSFSVQSLTNLPVQPHLSKSSPAGDSLHFKHFFSPVLQPLKPTTEQTCKKDKENSRPKPSPIHLGHSDSMMGDSHRRSSSVPNAVSCGESAGSSNYLYDHGPSFPFHPFHPFTFLLQHQHNLRPFPHCSLDTSPASTAAVFPLSPLLATSAFGSHSFLPPDGAVRRMDPYGSLFPLHQRPMSAEPAC